MKICVFGSTSFIGSQFIKHSFFNEVDPKTGETNQIVAVARNTSQKNFRRLDPLLNPNSSEVADDIKPYIKLIFQDLNDPNITETLEGVDVVVNFAAKTFVDHSVRDPKPFIDSNITGTYNLLEAIRKNPVKMFIQISTDEVYGACVDGEHTEESPMNPTNPYASSKAAADMLCMGYAQTFKIPLLITRTENNYGKYQHPQKVIPAWTKLALAGERLKIYGDGKQKRMWLRVEDNADAIWTLIKNDCRGIYHVAGGQELENIELAKIILETLGKPFDESTVEFIDDSKIRPNHDRRYAMKCEKLRALDWEPKWDLRGGIDNAVNWYRQTQWWLS